MAIYCTSFNEKEKSEKIEKINEGKVHTEPLRVFC